MPDAERTIGDVRIDLPQGKSVVYFFVSPSMGAWDRWWTTLYDYLVNLAGSALEWHHEPVQNVFVARPRLSFEQRMAIMEVLRAAPMKEIDGHRTLRRALRMQPEQQARIEVVYFAQPDSTESKPSSPA